MPEINVPLLRKQLEWATGEWRKAQRGEWSEWDQTFYIGRWSCGTTCCIAGKTALDLTPGGTLDGRLGVGLSDAYGLEVAEYAYSVARGELGLTDDQAELLFTACNTIRDLWHLAAEFTEGEIEAPADLHTA